MTPRCQESAPDSGNSGYTLVELLVAMTVFATLLSVLFGALLDFHRDLRKTAGVADAAEQGRKVFLRLDKQLRSASAVNRPVRQGSDWYLEFLTTARGTNPSALCTQWRVVAASGAVQTRTWSVSPAGVAGPPSSWATVGTGAVLVGQQPFSFERASTGAARQAILLHLDTRAGSNPPGTAETVTRVVARNTSTATETNDDKDGDGDSDTEVCRQVARA